MTTSQLPTYPSIALPADADGRYFDDAGKPVCDRPACPACKQYAHRSYQLTTKCGDFVAWASSRTDAIGMARVVASREGYAVAVYEMVDCGADGPYRAYDPIAVCGAH